MLILKQIFFRARRLGKHDHIGQMTKDFFRAFRGHSFIELIDIFCSIYKSLTRRFPKGHEFPLISLLVTTITLETHSQGRFTPASLRGFPQEPWRLSAEEKRARVEADRHGKSHAHDYITFQP